MDSPTFPGLDRLAVYPYRRGMAQSILIFDFGTNEEAAQQARHKVDAWKQGFRLGNKMLMKFERKEPAGKNENEDGTPEKHGHASDEKKSAAKKPGASAHEKKGEGKVHVRVLLRLDFSEHEKLSHQR